MTTIKNFPKLECPFVRDSLTYIVKPEINKGYEWVFKDEGVKAVDKLDGTNILLVIKNSKIVRIFNRLNEKNILRVNGKAFDKFILEGISNAIEREWLKKYKNAHVYGELIGKRINTNRHQLDYHLFVPFDYLKEKCSWHTWELNKYPKTFESISEWFKTIPSLFNERIAITKIFALTINANPDILAEGIVFHHPDGRMAKLRRDMFDWYEGERHNDKLCENNLL